MPSPVELVRLFPKILPPARGPIQPLCAPYFCVTAETVAWFLPIFYRVPTERQAV